jgi:pimeloyl-ACP methyl ester carboxylesterase
LCWNKIILIDKNRLEFGELMPDKKRMIILVHGSMGSNQAWKQQVRGLSEKAKVIAVDLPGHYGTTCIDLPTMETYVNFLDKYVNDLKGEKVVLGGHSLGGAVVLSYYLAYPEKVEGLILVGTGARLRVMPAILDLTKKNDPGLIKMMETVAFHKNTIMNQRKLIEEVNRDMAKTLPGIGYSDFSICNTFDVMDQLKTIKVPTLIICGEDDKLTPVKYATYLNEHISNSSLHIIKDAGHMVMLEQGDVVNKAITEFLNKL